jgi:hypothetical protein
MVLALTFPQITATKSQDLAGNYRRHRKQYSKDEENGVDHLILAFTGLELDKVPDVCKGSL